MIKMIYQVDPHNHTVLVEQPVYKPTTDGTTDYPVGGLPHPHRVLAIWATSLSAASCSQRISKATDSILSSLDSSGAVHEPGGC